MMYLNVILNAWSLPPHATPEIWQSALKCTSLLSSLSLCTDSQEAGKWSPLNIHAISFLWSITPINFHIIQYNIQRDIMQSCSLYYHNSTFLLHLKILFILLFIFLSFLCSSDFSFFDGEVVESSSKVLPFTIILNLYFPSSAFSLMRTGLTPRIYWQHFCCSSYFLLLILFVLSIIMLELGNILLTCLM